MFYMHVGGHGDAAQLAESLRAALALSKTPMSLPPAPAAPPPTNLDTAVIEKALGVRAAAATAHLYCPDSRLPNEIA